MYKRICLIMTLLSILGNGISQNSSKFISQSVPDNIQPGETFDISIVFQNTSSLTWTISGLYHLGSQSPQDNTFWGNTRINLPNDVAPGNQVEIKATLTAPVKEGLYNFQWQMVQDGVEWFGEKSKLVYYPILNPVADSLLSVGDHFSVKNHIVSTSFFTWYGAKAGQQSSPWIALDGRENWTGDAAFWKSMIKQTMMANIDVFYVELIPFMEDKRGNFFLALSQLRREGWDVPKVCPFMDPRITYDIFGFKGDCGTESGKDELIGHYIQFYEQFYSVNTDAFADDYIYTQDGSPVLNTWHIHIDINNYDQLTRNDVTSRLKAALGAKHSIFNNNIKMICNAFSPGYSFADEKIYQFEVQEYKIDKLHNGINSSLVKPGYWDQNVRNPGTLFPRDGGSHYTDAWKSVNADATIDRVYIESFNEYDEGSGIYAARTDSVYKKTDEGMNNTGNDSWSNTNDPYEYLKTTASGAAIFNDDEQLDSKIIWNNMPSEMEPNETIEVSIIVRNEGNEQWNSANNFKFKEVETDPILFDVTGNVIDDTQNEIPVYGGIFRGRPLIFNMKLTAPSTAGTYTINWQMNKEGAAWFGEKLTKQIQVKETNGINVVENEFSIYPNPANTIVSVENLNGKDKNVQVIDVTGKIIKQFENQSSNFNIHIADLEKGVYFIKVENTVKKIIKH